MTKRLLADVRKPQLLDHAVRIAAQVGYTNVSRRMVAEAAGLTPALISYHFGTMTAFRRTLMRRALLNAAESVDARRVVLQGLMAKDKHAAKCPADIRERALAEMSA